MLLRRKFKSKVKSEVDTYCTYLQIISELKSNNIEVYQFPVTDETVRKENTALNALIPFAIIGSTDFVTKEDGKQVRARRYPWGIVEGIQVLCLFCSYELRKIFFS